MKRITLKRLTLENWRAQNRTIDFSDKTIIRGANGTGKSTTLDAFLWLLCGVDSKDKSDFCLYDYTKDFTPENSIPAIVEGTFDVDGIEYKFKRTAKQKWVRKRGKSVYEKDKSDEYQYYIDDLSVSAKIYRERLTEMIADVNKMKLMLNVRYYQMLDWKTLRQHFADMAGEISDDKLKGDYSSIKELLEKYKNTDAAKEWLSQQINPLRKSNDRMDSEIKGMENMLPDISGIDDAQRMVDEIGEEIAAVDKEIANIGDANKPLKDKRQAEQMNIENLMSALSMMRNKYYEVKNAPISELQKQLASIQNENFRIGERNKKKALDKERLTTQIEMAENQAEFLRDELERLRGERDNIKARIFNENMVCPTCGQTMPLDKIESAREKFYAKRDCDLTSIVERGIKTKEKYESQVKLASDLKEQLESIPEPEQYLDSDEIKDKIEQIKTSITPFEDTEDAKSEAKQIEELKANLTEVPKVNTDELLEKKKTLNQKRFEYMQIIARKEIYDRGLRDIKAKKIEQSEICAELGRLEGLFDKCVEREREWAAIVKEKANHYLRYSSVEMTKITKGGDINDCCTVLIDGVDANGTSNTANKVRAGIDIANAFQKYADVCLPIILDNAEQVTSDNIPDIDNQLVLTIVDENHKDLFIV